ncbi:MAG: 3-hydroxyacyl-[acyl-carrier-protein] dehydratase FabZ [Rhodospirillaceae bacterium]|jgi:3-hydroxyacyl-[acyl-carrier-protein] dehydratase|nr:3-hydroxyacyl-[acyl-carrier-protein] dehydratase FabZ [Rhodospirillaceae bacterium]OUU53968.1 MAG: 3-hydroxyacyl-[acyl-carrier-protein] dehydratase FabZ [Candidatus Endolissoclinum sp. TMED55]|tara:strand:- start:4549 stop:4986 length:438 start_codon:yes stop_codon:yes gene_type:complete
MQIDINRIKELIPHRYPFLLIDGIQTLKPNESAIGIKNVSVNEPFFEGHFPERPVMPGVLIIESMAQTAGCLVVVSLGKESEGKLVYFMTIENARFRKPVVPGDRMVINVQKLRSRGSVFKFSGKAFVGEVLAAEATFSAMIVDK